MGKTVEELQTEVGPFARDFFIAKDAALVLAVPRQDHYASKECRKIRED